MAAKELKVKITADNKGLEQGLDRSKKSISGFSKAIKGAGVALAGLFAANTIANGLKSVIKAASDAEETFSKFATVFSNVAKSADIAFKDLRDNYGLSSKAAKQLLSDTGDLLTGFGFSQQAALDLSSRVNKLAVDLASFTNFAGGAAGASQALTKALLGERESVKALGISILEEDVKKQMAINTAKGLTFETERQAKAYATLDLALQQSKNSLGDYERTADGFSNQQRLLKERLDDLKVTIGELLLPAVNRLAGGFIRLTDSVREFIEDVTTETNFTKLQKFGRILSATLLGIATGGRFGRGISDPIFFEAWEQQAENLLTPLQKVQKRINEIEGTYLDYKKRVEEGKGGEFSTEEAKEWRALQSEINDLYRQRWEYVKQQKDAEAEAAKQATEAAEKARKDAEAMEAQRRAGLGEIGRLMEDIEKAEQSFIQSNSALRREYYAQQIIDLREKLELLSQEATLENKINQFLAARTGGNMGAPESMTPQSGALPVQTGSIVTEYNRALGETIILQNEAALSAEKWAQTMQSVQMIAQDAAYSIGEAFGQMAASGGRATAQLVNQAIAQAIAAIIRQLATTLPFPANIAAIAGAGMFSGIMRSQIPAYADGAVAFGPTLGLMGEYANASTNPEIIAPLDKLQGMLGGGTGEVEFRIKGQELWGVLKKYENRLNQNS